MGIFANTLKYPPVTGANRTFGPTRGFSRLFYQTDYPMQAERNIPGITPEALVTTPFSSVFGTELQGIANENDYVSRGMTEQQSSANSDFVFKGQDKKPMNEFSFTQALDMIEQRLGKSKLKEIQNVESSAQGATPYTKVERRKV